MSEGVWLTEPSQVLPWAGWGWGGTAPGHLGLCLLVLPLEVTSTSCQSVGPFQLLVTDQALLSPTQGPTPIPAGWPPQTPPASAHPTWGLPASVPPPHCVPLGFVDPVMGPCHFTWRSAHALQPGHQPLPSSQFARLHRPSLPCR